MSSRDGDLNRIERRLTMSSRDGDLNRIERDDQPSEQLARGANGL
jgi:hypothetical protein